MADDTVTNFPKKTPVLDTETKALLEVGFLKPSDGVIFTLIALTVFVSVLYVVFLHPPAIKIVACLLLILLLSITWTIILIYRVSYFVLKLSSAIYTLPETAARLAVAFHSQQVASQSRPGEPIKPLD